MLSDDHNTTPNYVAINSLVKFVTQAFCLPLLPAESR